MIEDVWNLNSELLMRRKMDATEISEIASIKLNLGPLIIVFAELCDF